MKLTIKTLQQSNFKIDIDPDKTVKELKDKIESDHGKDYPSGSQKLIYSGKILADESKISEYNIDEKKFIVLMITRPPPAPKPQVVASEKPAALVKKEEAASSKPKASDDKSKQSAGQQSSSSTTTASTTTIPSSATTTTSSANTTSTTPAHATTRASQPGAPARPAANTRPSIQNDSALSMNEPQMASRLTNMMMQPHFRQIQDLIQQSPHLLSSTIEALAGSDPEMYNFISDNPDVFVNALNHPPLPGSQPASGTRNAQTRLSSQQQAPASRNPAGGRQPVVDQVLVDVSEHDKEAIERLKELGFSEYLAVQAYMACDKDENLAANLLLQMDQ